MEQKIGVLLRDKKHRLSGTLRAALNARQVCIFVPGLLHGQNERLFFNACKYLSKYGYDSFRFDSYGCDPGNRHFEQSTLELQASDVMDVVDYFDPKYDRIHLICHSLGAVVALLCEHKNIASLTFWDPSLHPKDVFSSAIFSEEYNAYSLDVGFRFFIGGKMFSEAVQFPPLSGLIKRVRKPLKIIGAGQGGAAIGEKLYFREANAPKAYHLIDFADHNFGSEKSEHLLFKETLNWIRKN